MLQLQDLTIKHQKDLRTLIQNLNIVVNTGDKLAIIGEEGTGKSTLLQFLHQPDATSTYFSCKGNMTNHFKHVAYLPQHLPKAIKGMTVNDFLYQEADDHLMDLNLLYRLATDLELDLATFEAKHQLLASLSGGEKLKLQLIKLLSYEPDLILLDEPSNDLDLDTLRWLERFISQSQQTIIFISHDEQFLEATATAILHLELVKKRREAKATYQKMDYASYKIWRKNTFEKQLQIAHKERDEYAKKSAKNKRIQQRAQHQLRTTKNSAIGRILAKKMHALKGQERRFDRERENFTDIPDSDDFINLFFSHITPLPHRKLILNWEGRHLSTGQTVNLQVFGQDKLVITGKNGIGKTLLLKAILADLTARADVRLGYMPQDYEDSLDGQLSALAFLSQKTSEEKARTLLASLKFTREEVTHPLLDLSGGQKAKLFFAKMVLERANVLILDEPTRNFSPTSQPEIRKLLINFPGAIISVSHDRNFIDDVVNRKLQLTEDSLNELSNI
ncbi:ATP-binding cassette domain-containing protein [Streptococcus plurextorum]|uniref:ATP-binding cassette domain-containing protein n=1 Tax=Streptococcus plurextorum TaxID=456876 RepID=UPI00041AFECB|nr:ATP-binding cassette domain-containing protein [Streptococcus plurextorum]